DSAGETCRRTLMQILPGAAEMDFAVFGQGVSRVQEIIGDHFAPVQGGGRFTSAAVGKVVERLAAHGASGVGQSSWGPTGFAFARDPDHADFLVRRAGDACEPDVQIKICKARDRGAERTGVFIGGKDAFLALDMLDAAAKALLKPFEISLFADPAGSFTTAAAMIAVVEKALQEKKNRALKGVTISIFGATGVVGTAAGVIGALEGASVTFVGHDGTARVGRHADEVKRRFGVEVAVADGSTPEKKTALLASTEVALCAAKAGVRVLDGSQIANAGNLLAAADVNAVPPLGIEGLDLNANATPLGTHGALGIGALAIGNVKYRTEDRKST